MNEELNMKKNVEKILISLIYDDEKFLASLHRPLPPRSVRDSMPLKSYLVVLRRMINKLLDDSNVGFSPTIFETVDCEDINCPICMESFADGDGISMCSHKHEMHSYCLNKILESSTLKKCCPLCRTQTFI
jgi:hypothetical protein